MKESGYSQKNFNLTFLFIVGLLLLGCANLRTPEQLNQDIRLALKSGQPERALRILEDARKKKAYGKKDRVLFHLEKGAILHYLGNYQESNLELDIADREMEELFTKSISRALASLMLNDNVLEYTGEVYDNLFVNCFKALNYLHLHNPEAAYVEIRRLNDKLNSYDDQYSRLLEKIKEQDTLGITIEKEAVRYYNDALANYLSHIIFRELGEPDNSRISLEKARQAWTLHPEVYSNPMPDLLKDSSSTQLPGLLTVAFTGSGPGRRAVGGRITSVDSTLFISDLENWFPKHAVTISGVPDGIHFKFAFPAISLEESRVNRVEVSADGNYLGRLELLEDFGSVARETFLAKRNAIYLKTVLRSIGKTVAASKAKKKLVTRTKSEDNFFLRELINLSVDAMMDATENPDLRCWQSLPRYVHIGEFDIPVGTKTVDFFYYDKNGFEIHHSNFVLKKGQYFLEDYFLN
ncbi:MAG: hypothetical protein Kow0037_03330 [Calditrichia bacterium]